MVSLITAAQARELADLSEALSGVAIIRVFDLIESAAKNGKYELSITKEFLNSINWDERTILSSLIAKGFTILYNDSTEVTISWND